MKEKILLGAIALLFTSCHSIHIEKRRYMKGFHIEFAGKKERPGHNKATETAKEETKQEHVEEVSAAATAQQQVDLPGEAIVENTTASAGNPAEPDVSPTKAKPATIPVTAAGKEEHEQHLDLFSLLISALCGAGIFAFLVRKRKLKDASRWARDHKTASRILIALAHIFLAVAGLAGGMAFFGAGMVVELLY